MKNINALIGQGLTHPVDSQREFITLHKQEVRIDSRVFAHRIGIKSTNLHALIRKHKTELLELGTLPTFETAAVKKGGARGIKHERCFLLNEAQFDYMCRVVRGRDPLRMNQFKLDVTKAFSKRRTVEPLRREYLPGYHESRDGLKALGAQRHHYINLARAENRVAGLSGGERGSADEQQLGLLVVIQKIEQAAFNEAVHNGMSPGDAVREVARRMDTFASLLSTKSLLGGENV